MRLAAPEALVLERLRRRLPEHQLAPVGGAHLRDVLLVPALGTVELALEPRDLLAEGRDDILEGEHVLDAGEAEPELAT